MNFTIINAVNNCAHVCWAIKHSATMTIKAGIRQETIPSGK